MNSRSRIPPSHGDGSNGPHWASGDAPFEDWVRRKLTEHDRRFEEQEARNERIFGMLGDALKQGQEVEFGLLAIARRVGAIEADVRVIRAGITEILGRLRPRQPGGDGDGRQAT